jgi:large subunit ribosomal protein L24
MRIRTDDEVVVIAGKDKGKTGKVIRTDPKKDRVFVEGLNMVKRHQRPMPGRPNAPVGVIEKEGPIHVSNASRTATTRRSARRWCASSAIRRSCRRRS